MQTLTDYKRDITAEVTAYFEAKTANLLAAGHQREKHYPRPRLRLRQDHRTELRLLAGLHCLCALGIPYWRAFRASR